MQRLKTHEFGLRATSRIKTFVFKYPIDCGFEGLKNKLTLLKLTLIDRRLNVIAKITFQEIAQLQNYRNSAMSISVYSVFFGGGISLYLLIERIFFILYIIYI